ncbi:SDR family oxidoreductase [Patulibacter sp.]|uniref:SDR family NAD(P)-dependent oxidoreductase n=1 Tax=Patulibacter sp. TaxID=1912859 RepID=UPI002721D9A7|nr:SDR family NAD(P)-dependent oxidoreductase [Patulibacter sp.]MDO9408256.1 SDR family NAD(P)-dependent oxidoreductase [Patulibacter sp.]
MSTPASPAPATAPAGPLVAVITGASSGLGEAAAERLAREPNARIVLVARREDRLAALAARLPATVTWVAADLTDEDAPGEVRDHVRAEHGLPTLLVNNAGAGYRARFGSEQNGGWENVRRTMAINFDAVVRLTEALLPDLRAAAPSSIVNVSSTASRVSRPGTGAYSASKAALALWTDALRIEEAVHGVHVGNVLPGFVPTEGFPQTELVESRMGKYLLGTPEGVAEAIVEAGLGRKPERYTPKLYGLVAALRFAAPGLTRRVMGTDAAQAMTTKTVSDQ